MDSLTGLIGILRSYVQRSLDKGDWYAVLFYCDKLLSLTKGASQDLVYYVRALVETDQYLNALNVIKQWSSTTKRPSSEIHEPESVKVDVDLSQQHKVLKYLAVRCLLGTKQYEEAIKLIEYELLDETTNVLNTETPLSVNALNQQRPGTTAVTTTISLSTNLSYSISCDQRDAYLNQKSKDWNIDASFYLLLGEAYERLDNRVQARTSYEKCLKMDVRQFQAFERLSAGHLLTNKQKSDLIKDLPFNEQCSDDEERFFLKFLYESSVDPSRGFESNHKSVASDSFDQKPPFVLTLTDALATNSSILAMQAEQLYYLGDFSGACTLTAKILQREPYKFDCMFIHVCSLVRLGHVNKLFRLAHNLVDVYPDRCASWFAVACYYWCTDQIDACKQFFHKCTLLDPQSGESWIGFGHAFAKNSEHDQAMNSYVKAARLIPNSHLPLLYVGLEYASTNNLKLGSKFLQEALLLEPNDPHVLHEMGVLLFKQDNLLEAERHLRLALESLGALQNSDKPVRRRDFSRSSFWQPLLNNMGHVLRFLKRYDEAAQWHLKALCLTPRDASTLCALAFCRMFQGNFADAVDLWHQTLIERRDDRFASYMLTKCLDIMGDNLALFSPLKFESPPTLSLMKNGVSSSSSASLVRKALAPNAACTTATTDCSMECSPQSKSSGRFSRTTTPKKQQQASSSCSFSTSQQQTTMTTSTERRRRLSRNLFERSIPTTLRNTDHQQQQQQHQQPPFIIDDSSTSILDVDMDES